MTHIATTARLNRSDIVATLARFCLAIAFVLISMRVFAQRMPSIEEGMLPVRKGEEFVRGDHANNNLSQRTDSAMSLARALECGGGSSVVDVVRQHGIAFDGKRHLFGDVVRIFGVHVNAIYAVRSSSGVALYAELPISKVKVVADKAKLNREDYDDGTLYTRMLESGSTITVDDTTLDESKNFVFYSCITKDAGFGTWPPT